jgi:hypothetical protein
MGSPGNEMKVEVTQKNVSLTLTHDGSLCQPGSTGLRNVEFCASVAVEHARIAVVTLVENRILKDLGKP